MKRACLDETSKPNIIPACGVTYDLNEKNRYYHMKKLFFLISLLTVAASVSAVNGFGLEGNLVTGFSGKEVYYNPSIDGRVYFNDCFSAGIGLGILNSGVKDAWSNETENSTTFTSFRLSSNTTTPTLNVSLRGQLPLFKLYGHMISFYAEPKLIYIPLSKRQIDLYKYSFKKEIDSSTGEITYTQIGDTENSNVTSPNHHNIYGSISGGFSVEIKDDFELSIGYGYTNIDVFRYDRNENINGIGLADHLPGAGFQFLNIGFRFNYSIE
jgi:hypothetical protein